MRELAEIGHLRGIERLLERLEAGRQASASELETLRRLTHELRFDDLVRHLEPATRRELDVLEWLSKGKTNRDIGESLGMSPRTVNKHLEHIYTKLGVETRTAAVAQFDRLQLGADG